ncbi:putative oxidoreductase [Platysternon megacephalum]|uniref:Putative oxidoreductase n=1 Tax=Platysternon megacephalum TaxID=55544 RepID=A0A4D9DRQ5_9SAUR|nr:putative oxidoreductase [Platysternon megacephalum]
MQRDRFSGTAAGTGLRQTANQFQGRKFCTHRYLQAALSLTVSLLPSLTEDVTFLWRAAVGTLEELSLGGGGLMWAGIFQEKILTSQESRPALERPGCHGVGGS